MWRSKWAQDSLRCLKRRTYWFGSLVCLFMIFHFSFQFISIISNYITDMSVYLLRSEVSKVPWSNTGGDCSFFRDCCWTDRPSVHGTHCIYKSEGEFSINWFVVYIQIFEEMCHCILSSFISVCQIWLCLVAVWINTQCRFTHLPNRALSQVSVSLTALLLVTKTIQISFVNWNQIKY